MTDENDLRILGGNWSGSVDGKTYSRNQYGRYVRNRTFPAQPGTPEQLNCQQALTNAVAAWPNLFAAQRPRWDTYAAHSPLLDRLGRPQTIPGMTHFIRSYIPRDMFGLPLPAMAPQSFGLPRCPEVSIIVDTAFPGNEIQVTVEDVPGIQNDGVFLSIATYDPVPPSINFYAAPFRIVWVQTKPPLGVFPLSFSFPAFFGAAPGFKNPFRVRYSSSDTRLSAADRYLITAV